MVIIVEGYAVCCLDLLVLLLATALRVHVDLDLDLRVLSVLKFVKRGLP